jgi:Membrane bound FAD containing D-sorbitol dehydrogenase
MAESSQQLSGRENLIGRATFLKTSLLTVVGIAFGPLPSAAGAGGNDLDGFLRLSRITSGVHNLSPKLARKYYAALEADGVLALKPSRLIEMIGLTGSAGPATLAELKRTEAFRTHAGKDCVRAVASAWWSGIVPTAGGGQKVITFSDALVWREVHEPLTCQGATGSWSKPGRAVG